MMIWGPRDEEELDVVWSVVRESYAYATGEGSGSSTEARSSSALGQR